METKEINLEKDPESNPEKNRRPLIIGIILFVILSIGAAFVGGRLLKERSDVGLGDGVKVDLSQVEGIPDEDPETGGFVTKIDGNTLTIQEFNINTTLGAAGNSGVIVQAVEIDMGEGGESSLQSEIPSFMGDGGQSVEVIISRDTKIFKDATFTDMEPIISADGEMPELPELPDEIVMKVEPASADQIETNSIITVWGNRTGDRVVAEVILFQPGMSFGAIEP